MTRKGKRLIWGMALLAVMGITTVTTAASLLGNIELGHNAIQADSAYSATLNSSVVPVLTDGAGTMTITTAADGQIGFAYDHAALVSGSHVKLQRTTNGNNDGSEGYIKNTSPFSGLVSVQINFTGTYVTIYGSTNGSNWYRIKTIDTSETTTAVANYQYLKICSGDKAQADVTISSVVFSYNCTKNNAFDTSDLLNEASVNSQRAQLDPALDSTLPAVYDAAKSSTYLLIDSNLITVTLPEAIKKKDLVNYNFVFEYYCITGSNIPLQFNVNGVWANSEMTSAKATWTSQTVDLSVKATDSEDVITTFTVKENWGSDHSAYMDELHVVEKDTFPADAPTGMTISGESTVRVGETTQLSVAFTPEGSKSDYTVTWVSSTPGAATIDDNGQVTGVAVGSTTITGSVSSLGISDTFDITISAATALNDLSAETAPSGYSSMVANPGTWVSGATTYTVVQQTDYAEITWNAPTSANYENVNISSISNLDQTAHTYTLIDVKVANLGYTAYEIGIYGRDSDKKMLTTSGTSTGATYVKHGSNGEYFTIPARTIATLRLTYSGTLAYFRLTPGHTVGVAGDLAMYNNMTFWYAN